MRKTAQIFLTYILPLGIGIALFWYVVVFKNKINFDDVWAIFTKSNPIWLFLSFVFAIVSHWARAYRSRLLLQPLGYELSTAKSFLAVMDGYFANLLLPRAGELVRCGMVQKMEKIPSQVTLGTVITERVIDLVILLSMLSLMLVVEFGRLTNVLGNFIGKNVPLERLFMLGGIGIGIVLIIAGVLYALRKKIQTLPFYGKIKNIFIGIWQGMLSIKKLERKGLFILLTVLIWVMYYLMSYVLFFCIPQTENLSLWAGFTVLIMGGIGMALPVQGGIGAYHILVGTTLGLYALEEKLSGTIATFMHAWQTLVIIAVGGLAMLISLFITKKEKPQT